MSFVEQIEPQALWRHFDRILSIPRGSKEEGRIREYVLSVAEAHGLSHRTDAAGNVVVRKPASAGNENSSITILQSHLDMVNEKNSDVAHDFTRDPIKPRREGDWLYATGTTLGADNGIGVAAMLAVLEAKELEHGPLELLFTIDEETGLTGASSLDASLLQGRQLINLDSEEEGTVTVGCAGGAGTVLRLTLEQAPAGSGQALAVTLRGMHGGHSGIDIHLQRGNAVKLLGRVLHAAWLEAPFRLVAFEGGNKHNAIPREATATLLVEGDAAKLRAALEAEFAGVRAEYAKPEPGMELAVHDVASPAEAWTPQVTHRVLDVIEALPHGVIVMSNDIPGLVETSTNVATCAVQDGRLAIGTSTRSSVASALRAVRRQIRAVAALADAEVEEGHGYPGWKPDLDSKLLAVLKQVHAEVQGSEPEIVAVHAGLECGIIGEKSPGMDMISFGPQIEHPHSPNERVHIESVGRFYRLLATTLARLT